MTVSSGTRAVLQTELLLRLRGWRWAGVATLYVGILAVIAVSFLLHRYSLVASAPSKAGAHLFQTLALGELFLMVFVVPATLAGAISGERQQGTWDLLMSSPTSIASVVWGKLLAGICFNLVLLAASLPLFALVFLFGGMTLTRMIPTFLVFLATIVLLGAISLAASALTPRLTVSYMVSMLLALLLVVGIALATVYVEATGRLGPLALGSLPFLAGGASSPLPPVAQLDPLIALLAALPGDSGGTLLGGLGHVHHAFGLPWTLPLWGAYLVLATIVSLVLIVLTPRLAASRVESHPWAIPARSWAGGGQ